MKDKFYHEELNTSVYFDKREEKILANILFKYGNIEIGPFQSEVEGGERILIRDIEGEKKIISILENFHFKRENYNYVLEDEEKLLNFMSKGMELLQEVSEVYYSESFKNIKIYTKSSL